MTHDTLSRRENGTRFSAFNPEWMTDWGMTGGHGRPTEQAGRAAAAQSALLISDQDVASNWHEMLRTTGARMLDAVSVAEGAGRLSSVIDVDLILLDCRRPSAMLETLVSRLDMMAHSTGVAALLIASLDTLDMVDSLASAPSALVLCAPENRELLAAIHVGFRFRRLPDALHDSGTASEPAAEKNLDKLSDELGRLSGMIEMLMQEAIPERRNPGWDTQGVRLRSTRQSYNDMPTSMASAPLDAQQIRALIRARRLRDQMLPNNIFADPAWDILLDLMAAHLEGNRVSVSSLCIAAAVPPTTALRWIRQLTDHGLLLRQADNADGRRVFITLSSEGIRAVEQWFLAARTLLVSAAG